jgi:hypothetical protein
MIKGKKKNHVKFSLSFFKFIIDVCINRSEFVSDFDLMMARKKDEKRKRKRKDVDIINDNDDLIAHMIQQMKAASEVKIFFESVINNINAFFNVAVYRRIVSSTKIENQQPRKFLFFQQLLHSYGSMIYRWLSLNTTYLAFLQIGLLQCRIAAFRL